MIEDAVEQNAIDFSEEPARSVDVHNRDFVPVSRHELGVSVDVDDGEVEGIGPSGSFDRRERLVTERAWLFRVDDDVPHLRVARTSDETPKEAPPPRRLQFVVP